MTIEKALKMSIGNFKNLSRGYRLRKPWFLACTRASGNFTRMLDYLDMVGEVEPAAWSFKRKLLAMKKAQRSGYPALQRELAQECKALAYHLRRMGRL